MDNTELQQILDTENSTTTLLINTLYNPRRYLICAVYTSFNPTDIVRIIWAEPNQLQTDEVAQRLQTTLESYLADVYPYAEIRVECTYDTPQTVLIMDEDSTVTDELCAYATVDLIRRIAASGVIRYMALLLY